MNTDSLKFRVWYNSKSDNKGWRMADVCSLHINKNKVIIANPPFGNISIDLDHNAILEQCTGLKDKNGKLIFEGDVVCYDDTPYNGYATKKTGVVVYRKAEFCYRYSDCCGGLYQPLVPSDDFWQRKTEIVGNVHEMEDKDEENV